MADLIKHKDQIAPEVNKAIDTLVGYTVMNGGDCFKADLTVGDIDIEVAFQIAVPDDYTPFIYFYREDVIDFVMAVMQEYEPGRHGDGSSFAEFDQAIEEFRKKIRRVSV